MRPILYPDEGIWNLLKRIELKNVCCRDLTHLATLLLQAKERLRHKRSLIRACIAKSRLSVRACCRYACERSREWFKVRLLGPRSVSALLLLVLPCHVYGFR